VGGGERLRSTSWPRGAHVALILSAFCGVGNLTAHLTDCRVVGVLLMQAASLSSVLVQALQSNDTAQLELCLSVTSDKVCCAFPVGSAACAPTSITLVHAVPPCCLPGPPHPSPPHPSVVAPSRPPPPGD
jgi:hypothetical protein